MSGIMVRRFVLLLSAILLAAGCGQRGEPKGAGTLEIPVQLKGPARVTGISLYDIVEHPRTIVVDPPEPMMGIYQLKYVRGRYYMSDVKRRHILVFDDEGRILLDLSRRGRAEYEYVSMQCFDVNPANGEISVYDVGRRRMVVYSEDGAYLRSFDLGEGVKIFHDFAVREDGSYLIYITDVPPGSGRPSGLVGMDRDGNLTGILAPLDEDFHHTLGLVPYTNFHRLSDGTLTVHGEQDKNEIYHVGRDGELSVPYHIAYDVTWSAATREMTEPFDEPDYYCISKYFETDHWLGMLVLYQNKYPVLVYYDKAAGNCYVGKVRSGENKMSFKDVLPLETGDMAYYEFSAGDRLLFADNPSSYKAVDDDKIYVKVYMEKAR